jgi:hypothetical protein
VHTATALALAGLALAACARDGEHEAPSAAPSASASSRFDAPSASPTTFPEALPSSGAMASASASAAPNSPPLTVRRLLEEATKDPTAFDGKSVKLDGFYLGTSPITFGTGEHPRHMFVVARFTLERGGADVLECWFDERRGPPALQAGDATAVAGKWSFGRVMRGGVMPSGGALHLAQCSMAPASSPP